MCHSSPRSGTKIPKAIAELTGAFQRGKAFMYEPIEDDLGELDDALACDGAIR